MGAPPLTEGNELNTDDQRQERVKSLWEGYRSANFSEVRKTHFFF